MARSVNTRCIAIIYAIACAIFVSSDIATFADAFAFSNQKTTRPNLHSMAGFLDDVGSFFDGLGGDSNSDESSSSQSELVEEIDGVYTGSKRIITIPAKTMKSGGLRLYCNLFLMGVQNTPEKGCWKASQSDNSEVNLRYVDLSGSIIIRFTEDGITVDRLGSSPSTKYLIAESMILNGFLDELHSIVYGGDVSEQNRLLTLMESDVIEKARGFVSFG
mmetsp:Transcript_15779/g.29867  ORF Transcript_15779/g.29867 Transcript_15779/m.29867 type:complete len:218 (-) Transcript_15779:263-916(-)|eukprot:CAMPEP_0201680094 /NCGR_PEP_ID=MMETSP0494-20130426/50030_1 /ASSEMBLY_ACC=CAM_ASM_000839 /TAXON_ID=420259 /ORGANISM="Thalassiosira gravida, Strain GMp14c1" /LENGTH=217 /DNA_ID=CAMNT_0048163755 /DNA_START=69 /DNA_END=722 /DNA_ORIENTATION=+